MRRQVLGIVFMVAATGCSWRSFGVQIGDLGGEKCSEYSQAKTNGEATVKYAEQLEVSGKISHGELIKIDQDAALYSKRLHDACNMFYDHLMTSAEYKERVDKASSDYEAVRSKVLNK